MNLQRSSPPRLFAHRGSGILAPENTLPAFQLASAYGADVLETDVRISADNRVMVIHDASVNRTTNGSGLVRELDSHALHSLDAGFHARGLHGQVFRGQGVRLLSLDELFDHYPDTAINIDIKDNERRAAELVAETIRRCRRTEDTTVGSFHSDLLVYFRSIAPEVKTSAVQREVARLFLQHVRRPLQSKSRKLASESTSLEGLDYCSLQIPVSYKLIPLGTAGFIRHVHEQGKEVCFWTVNKPSKMRQLLSLGADGIVTDRIDLARQVLDEMGWG